MTIHWPYTISVSVTSAWLLLDGLSRADWWRSYALAVVLVTVCILDHRYWHSEETR